MLKRVVGIAIVLGVGAALGAGLLSLADRGDRQASPPTASPSPSESPEPSASPSPGAATYVVTASSCLRVRERPALDAKVLDCIASGATLQGDGRTDRADGMEWAHVFTPKFRLNAWASMRFLERIDDGAEDEEPEP